MPSENPSNPFRSGPPREVEADGIAIGRHPLPPLPPGAGGDDEGPRRIARRPFLWGDSGRNLLWFEEDDDEDEVPMIWLPEGDDEARGAFALFERAYYVMGSPDDEDEDEGGEGSGRGAIGPRWFLSMATNPPELRSLAGSGGRLEESSGPIGAVARSESREAADVGSALGVRAAGLIAGGFVEIVPLERQIADALPPARIDGDPGYWSRPESWEGVRDLLLRLNPWLEGHVPPDPSASIAAFEAEWGFPIPPSYRAFLRVFGPGDARDRFFTLLPAGGPWRDSIAATTGRAREAAEASEGPGPAARMVFFCTDFAANQFGWDPVEPTDAGAGECAILEWPHGWDDLERVASSFPEFFLRSLLRDDRGRLDRAPRPTFHPNPPDAT